MSLKDQLKEEVRVERQKMKEMSFQDKLWYIWEYYKFHIGGVFLVILLVSVVVTSVRNASIHPGLYCIIVNNRSAQELDVSPLEKDFYEYMGFGQKEPVYVESMYISYGDSATELSYASMAKISALVASQELDILMGDEENINQYASLDGLADLKELLPADVLSAVDGCLFYAPDGAGQPVAAAVDISGTPMAAAMHLSDEAAHLSIFSNSPHTDNAVALIRYIFDL